MKHFIDKIFCALRCPPVMGIGIMLISVSALAAAFISQYGFGLQPCILCIYQRWPYAITIIFGTFILLIKYALTRKILIGLSGMTYWAGAAIAAFHVGVEQGWWKGTEECGGSLPTEGSLEDMLEAIKNAPVVRCTEIQWEMFGISMAGYNFLMSLGLGAICLLSLFLMLGKKDGTPCHAKS